MTTTMTSQPQTVLAVLYGTEADAPQQAEQSLSFRLNRDLLARVPHIVRAAAVGTVATAAVGLLGVGLGGLVAEGWREHRDLTDAARRTLAAPGTTELVRLAEHTITMTRQPYISVLVNGVEVDTVELELSLGFDISALVAGISGGKLTALHAGRCDISATLAVQGVEVAARQARIELRGTISPRAGLRLLPGQAYLSAPRGTRPMVTG